MKHGVTDTDFSLGGPDAWGNREGENLRENFLAVQQFNEISDREKTFLSGRRGSGKSAIVRMLATETNRWKFPNPIQGESNEYGEYMNVVSALTDDRTAGYSINIKDSVRRLWKWVLPIVAMQTVVVKTLDRGEALDDDTRHLKDYLDALPYGLNARSRIGHLLSRTFGHARRLLKKGDDFQSALLDLVNAEDFNLAIRCLERKARKESVLLALDTLESYKIFEPYMVEGLQGVLQAITEFLNTPEMSGITVKFFIPAEIYDYVSSGFPGKIEPRTVFLRWRAADLIAMLARRFLSVLRRTEAVSEPELHRLQGLVDKAYDGRDGRHLLREFWYDTGFLPRTIKNRLGIEEKTFPYILRHTMRRPRDLITAQMQSIIKAAKEGGEFPYISEASVVSGVHDPVSLLQVLKESLGPYEDQFPQELVAGAQSIFSDRSIMMTGRELRNFAKELYALHELKNIRKDTFITTLLRCGAIGLLEDGGAETKQSPYFKVRFEHLMQGTLPLRDSLTYFVHPVMADVFNMKRLDLERVVYPTPVDDTWLERDAERLGL